MKDEKEEEEKSPPKYDLPAMVRNDLFISPEQAHHREIDGNTPTRVLSSHSLVGEDFILSARPSLDFPGDIALSPFTPSEGTRTPPISLPDPVTPPPLHPLPSLPSPTSPPNRASRSQPPMPSSGTTSSLPGRMRPPRVPQVSLQPARGANNRHGRGLSNSDYSFLSALTDGTNDVPNPTAATQSTGIVSAIAVPRRRTVSWDFNDSSDRANNQGTTDNSIRSTPASILQPILREEIRALPASIVTDLVPTAPISPPTVLAHASLTTPAQLLFDSGQNKEPMGPIWNPTSAQDTGSLIHALDHSESPCTPSSGRRKKDPRRTNPSDNPKQYTVQDVLQTYPPEPPEETMLMSRIGSQSFSGNHSSLVPEVPSDALRQLISYNSDEFLLNETNDPGSVSAGKHQNFHSADDSFEGITKKLLDGSPKRRRGSSKITPDLQNQREGPEQHQRHAGDKMYAAAEAIFGQYADSMMEKDEETAGQKPEGTGRGRAGRNVRSRREHYPLQAFTRKAREDWSYFAEFLGPHRPSLLKEFLRLGRMIMIPSLLIATLLFYVFENPPTGFYDPATSNSENEVLGINGKVNPASISWLILFCGVRQMITLKLAQFSQLIIIDFFTLRTRPFPKILGPTLALLVAQAKGWPFILTFWALWDFALLFGDHKFAHHWGFWQDWIDMFNETNPHGSVTSGDIYSRILVLAVTVGVAMSVKRAIMGQIVGKRVVRNYRGDMARLMQKLIIMNNVAQLSLKLDPTIKTPDLQSRESHEDRGTTTWGNGVDGNLLESGVTQGDSFDYSDGFSAHSRGDAKSFTATAQLEILELLEAWEEPELQGTVEEEITVGTILQFRRALSFVSDEYPFSPAFGSVRTREDCVKSAQVVFERLTGGPTQQSLNFEVLCLVAKDSEGNVDRNTVRELIRVFRPNRNGQLSKLDFVKSVDSVFKSLRLLLASIQNSQQIDKAYETIVNVFFYICAAFVIMAVLGVNLEALIIGLGTVLVSIAFMIGPTSSNYLEGILFVLARKPYDIGDMVNIDDVIAQSNTFGGESCWVIEKVDLFTTTARLGATRELATFSNGSLSMMRIKNMNRSDKPNIFLNLKFSLDTTVQQRQMFKRRMTAFVKERPREWIRLVDFRSTRVETDLGFVEYVLVLQHREKWQNLGAILTSRGEVFTFAVELQKALHMKYRAPRVPIDIRRVETESSGQSQNGSDEMDYLDESKKER